MDTYEDGSPVANHVMSRRDGTRWHRGADDKLWFHDRQSGEALSWTALEAVHGPLEPDNAWRALPRVPVFLPHWVASLRGRLGQPHELTQRDVGVLRMRFGLGDCRPRSRDDIGFIYGVTRERIRQIERAALEALNVWPPLVKE